MRKTIDILKFAAASQSDQINKMSNSIKVTATSRSNPTGLYTKTEMGGDHRVIPADDLHKVAAISPRNGLGMLSSSSRSSSSGLSSLKKGIPSTKPPKVTEGVMQDQLDASQFHNSLDRKNMAHQAFSGATESRRTLGLGSELKSI